MIKHEGGKVLLAAEKIIEQAGITEKMKVADLGCGTSGLFVFGCARRVGREGRIYAVDVLKEVLDLVKRRAQEENLANVITVWSDLEKFGAAKIPSGSLDAAFLINTLFQSNRRVEIIREAVRLLKTKGRLVVVEWKSIALPFGPPLAERVKIEALKTGTKRLGLELEDEFDAGPYHYGLVLAKF